MANLKTKSTGDGYPKKAIEKTVLRFLGARTFSHGLAPKLPFQRKTPDALPRRRYDKVTKTAHRTGTLDRTLMARPLDNGVL